MKKIVLSLIFVLSVFDLWSEDKSDSAEKYIDRYSSLAVEEMYRSGIPASIILAQGMLESGNGTGMLAVKANNHFGIKCHSDWTGNMISKDDDAKNECFRKYPEVVDSYRDHSDFLRYKPRYASLFDFEITDYKSWAYGLSKAGYATDPKYASKLINLIEKYNLGRFDSPQSGQENTGQAQPVLPPTPRQLEDPVRFSGGGRSGSFAVSLSREVLQINNIPFIYAREGETYKSIAEIYELFPGELSSFNDSKDIDRKLKAGELVYLAHKSKKAAKGLDKHICSEGETLWEISQKYAVKLKFLMKLNDFSDAETILGEDTTLYLR